MLTIKEMTDSLNDSANTREQDTADKVRQLQYASAEYRRALSELSQLLPKIEAGLKTLGLGISQLGYFQTGDELWTNSTQLKVSIQAQPISGKFKFIAFNGYTTDGSGKNQKRLDEKAETIRKALDQSVGVASFQVNQYSLEAREGKQPRVLIDFWVS